ncbi:hypothetical protein LOK49_LG13G01937 [Camellia lanceoleosa]|uniref:Uncharacterized protein n=1 Tax=Camellia lanceoleosa TaxID=1840588 RepID=A0ACC0FLM1_9ERIC|nr:hypothetical protein LOK49_LG13G01937 [Camellia lanceoleosa]
MDLAFDLSLAALLEENINNFGELLAHPIDLAFDLSLAALLGENIYNFGELLAHPIISLFSLDVIFGLQYLYARNPSVSYYCGRLESSVSIVKNHRRVLA